MNRPEIAGVRQWIYAARIKGKYQSIHRVSGILLHAILFITPWLSLGGHPMLRLDLPGRRLYALGQIFTPSDTIFLVLIGLFLAFALFFFTALYGRLWCGYLCPQTVFLEEWIRRIKRRSRAIAPAAWPGIVCPTPWTPRVLTRCGARASSGRASPPWRACSR